MGAVAPVIGAVLNIIGQDKEQKLSAAEAVANQKLAESAAAEAQRLGAVQAGKIRMGGTQLAARQHLAYANSGVDATVGTPADVQGKSAAMNELDALTVENNALREAWGYKVHGLRFEQQASLNAQRAQYQRAGSYLALAGAGAKAYGDWKAGSGGGGEYGGFGGDAPASPGSIQDQKAGGY